MNSRYSVDVGCVQDYYPLVQKWCYRNSNGISCNIELFIVYIDFFLTRTVEIKRLHLVRYQAVILFVTLNYNFLLKKNLLVVNMVRQPFTTNFHIDCAAIFEV